MLYCRHALQRLRIEGELPGDFVKTGEAIDPGNGWYRFQAGLVTWIKARTSNNAKAGHAAGTSMEESTVRVIDELRAAIAMPRFSSHRDEFISRQIAAFPPARDYPELALQRSCVSAEADQLFDSQYLGLTRLPELVSSISRSTIPREDLSRLFESTLRKIALDSKSIGHQKVLLGESNVVPSTLIELGKLLRPSDSTLRHMAQVTQLGTGSKGCMPQPPERWSFAPVTPIRVPILLASKEETQPTALAVRAMVERLSLRFGLIVMLAGFCGCALAHLRWRKSAGPLAARVASLLRPVDHLLIAFVSLILPISLFQLLVRGGDEGILYCPLDWSSAVIMNSQQASCILAVAIIVLIVEMVCWRLGRRGAVLGMRLRGFHPGWFFAITALAAFGLAKIALSAPWVSESVASFVWTMPALALSWPVILFFFGRGPKPERKLHRCTLTRAMLPYFALGCMTFTTLIVLAWVEDRHWTALDTVEKASPDRAGNVTLEMERAAVWNQQRLVEALELK
ncbi:MAG: hypothetical protein QM755_17450 [Luteolibacter sp.]